MKSVIALYAVATGEVTEVLRVEGRVEAPNVYPDGRALLVNEGGLLYRIPLDKPAMIPVDTGAAIRCNNDHGISPDGSTIVLSSHHEGEGSQVYLLPIGGGEPRRVSPAAPSWWHGWSPDGAWLAYPAARGGSRVLDLYRLHLPSGREERLTGGEGHHDGPDYAPDGATIYYNCDRTGHAQIWTIAADGANPRQLFSDDHVNWFPHPSPDGRHLLYLAYPPGTEGHPADLEVALVLCRPDGTERRRVLEFTGGQGTINVPNWAPDNRFFAFVRYEP
jgi:Tol biopolymer transport system component